MVKHMVLWKFREELTEEEKEQAKARIKKELEALVGVVPGLINAYVVTEPLPTSTYDIGLITSLDSRESLEAYATNPDHVKAAQFVRSVTCGRGAMDFEE